MSSLRVQTKLTGVRPVTMVVCFCCSFLWSVQSAMASELDDIRLPVDASAQWVSANLTHNGMSMAVKRFVSPQSVDEVLKFYRQLWQDNNTTTVSQSATSKEVPGYVENSVGQWRTIGRLERGYSIVLQVRPSSDHGVEGFLSGYHIDGSQTKPRTKVRSIADIPVMSGSQTVSHTSVSNDPKSASTMIVTNQASVSSNYRFYQDVMPRNGWALSTGSDRLPSSILMYAKAGAQAEISISQVRGESVVVINRTHNEVRP